MTEDRRPMGTRFRDYEEGFKDYLEPNRPTIIRLDGCSFSKFTKGLLDYDSQTENAPFSDAFSFVMQRTAQHLTEQMQNVVLAYTQSDEISVLLRDWDHERTEQWFNGNVQKITSVSSAICTSYFNNLFHDVFKNIDSSQLATFDSRVFQVPFDEVTNYFIWRQSDAYRNAINQIGRYYMSHKQMHKMSNINVIDTLLHTYGVDVQEYSGCHKYGTAMQKRPDRSYYIGNDQFKDNREIVENVLLRE